MMTDVLIGLLLVVFGLCLLYFAVWLFILLPAEMAEGRNRNQLFWVLVSLLVSPFIACLLLLALGQAGD